MKRGFTLTLSMVILLVFMTTILTVETQKVSIEEQTHSQHAKLRAINSILLDLNSPSFEYSVSKMGKRAMFNVINEEIAHKEYVGDAKKAICKEFEKNFETYIDMSLGTRLNDTGLSIKYTNMNCEVELIDAFTVNLTTSVDLTFVEENKIEIKKSISLNTNFSIEGLPEPSLAIESYKADENDLSTLIVRPILMSPLYENETYWTNSKFEELELKSSNLLYAKGWVYGEVIDYNKNNVNNEKYQKEVRGNILLIPGSLTKEEFKDAIEFAESNFTKGIIINKYISSETTEEKNKDLSGCIVNYTKTEYKDETPCIRCGTFGVIDVTDKTCEEVTCASFGYTSSECQKDGNKLYYNKITETIDYSGVYGVGTSVSSGKYVLIDEVKEREVIRANEAKAYNIEIQRSATLCGNYFLNDKAPDIFSRMEGNLGAKDEYGIETFVLGTWVLEEYSKLDYQYYTKKDGVKVKGMLGCKDESMCDSEIPNIGQFTIKESELDKYGMERIKYDG